MADAGSNSCVATELSAAKRTLAVFQIFGLNSWRNAPEYEDMEIP
jgi:hypothetical protein